MALGYPARYPGGLHQHQATNDDRKTKHFPVLSELGMRQFLTSRQRQRNNVIELH